MKLCFALLVLCIGSFAQSTSSAFDREHEEAVKQNPPNVTLTIATSRGGLIYHVSDVIKFSLSFTSSKHDVYTVEADLGGSAAAASDDFVILGPDSWNPVHSLQAGPPKGVVCCGTQRKYLSDQPITIPSFVSLREVRFLNIRELFHQWLDLPQAGDYFVFVQTRRVMRGWPKEKDKYFKTGDDVVTSENVQRITLLPDGTDIKQDAK